MKSLKSVFGRTMKRYLLVCLACIAVSCSTMWAGTLYGDNATYGAPYIYVMDSATGAISNTITNLSGDNGRGVVVVGDTLFRSDSLWRQRHLRRALHLRDGLRHRGDIQHDHKSERRQRPRRRSRRRYSVLYNREQPFGLFVHPEHQYRSGER